VVGPVVKPFVDEAIESASQAKQNLSWIQRTEPITAADEHIENQ